MFVLSIPSPHAGSSGGPQDGYMPAESARAYLRDVPEAELHLIEDAGHWLLETHFDDALPLIRDLSRTLH